MADQGSRDDGDDGGAVGFLQRWSRRKRHGDAAVPEPEADGVTGDEGTGANDRTPASAGNAARPQSADPDADDRIDPRTGKRFDELTDDDMPDVEHLDQDADVSAFLARGVSHALRLAALRKLWHTPKFNQLDLMSEYSGDFTKYQKIGTIIPHDMKRAAQREMERARQRQEELEARAREEADARQAGVERHEGAQQGDDREPDVGQNDPGVADGSGSDGPGSGGGSPEQSTESGAREQAANEVSPSGSGRHG